MNVLHVEHDAIRRGRRRVLDAGAISCAVPAAVAVIGVNGSGKSSLFMHLTRTLTKQPSRARVSVAGEAVSRFGYVPQVPALPSWLRVERAARLFACDYAQLCDALPGLHLAELRGMRVNALSVGQRQGIALAIALCVGAPLLVLDEPFSALDFRRRLGVTDLLHAWKNAAPHRALLISSQHAADLFELCDYYVVLRRGRYVFTGTRDELIANASEPDALRACHNRIVQLLT